MNTTSTDESYNGVNCPHCKSDNITGGSVTIELRSAWQECSCADCDSTWVDNYKLTGYSDLEVVETEEDEGDDSGDQDGANTAASATFVRTIDADGFTVPCQIETDLSDRWGDLDLDERDRKPSLGILQGDKLLQMSLSSMMYGERSAIARMDGEFGILLEQAFCTQESEAEEGPVASTFPTEGDMIERLAVVTKALAPRFPSATFVVPNTDLVYKGRAAMWAFVALKDRDLVDIKAMGDAFFAEAKAISPDEVTLVDHYKPVLVRTTQSSDFSVEWKIECDLSDRWGELNVALAYRKPGLAILTGDDALHESLRGMMRDELTFIVRKDGEFGVLFEQEFITRESDDIGEELDQYVSDVEMVERLSRVISVFEARFPNVQFALPHSDLICNGRQGLWGFVALKDCDSVDLDALQEAFLTEAFGKLPTEGA